MNSTFTKFLFVIIALLTPSCVFMRDRGRDLSRVVEADIGTSTGFNAHLGFSHVAEAGLGWYSGSRYGLREGALVHVIEERAEFGVPFVYFHEVNQRVITGRMPGRATAHMLAPGYERFPLQWFSGQLVDRDPFDFHLGLNAVCLGFSVSLKPLAFLDFVAGFVGVDFRDNDLGKRRVEDVLPDLHSRDALTRRRAVARLEWITGQHWPEYQTPPKRELFLADEKRVLSEMEAELIGLPPGQTRSSAHAAVPGQAVNASHTRLPDPLEASPASRAANGAK